MLGLILLGLILTPALLTPLPSLMSRSGQGGRRGASSLRQASVLGRGKIPENPVCLVCEAYEAIVGWNWLRFLRTAKFGELVLAICQVGLDEQGK